MGATTKVQTRLPTLTFKPIGDIAINHKEGYQWSLRCVLQDKAMAAQKEWARNVDDILSNSTLSESMDVLTRKHGFHVFSIVVNHAAGEPLLYGEVVQTRLFCT